MTAINAYLTEDGLGVLINAAQAGIGPVLIDEVAFGDSNWTPSPDSKNIVAVSALVNEVKRVSAISGTTLDNNRLHITAKDVSADTYDVSEIGIYSDGTLIAVAASASDFFSKGASKLLVSIDFVLSGNAIASITIDDIGFSNPAATTDDLGVVEIATQAEVNTGTDTERVVTPETLAGNMAIKLPTALEYGLLMSHNTGVINTISAGRILDSTKSLLMTIGSSMNKRLDASFATGSGNGALSSSLTLAANTTYHWFVVKTSGGAIDIAADTSPVAANLITDHGIVAWGYIGARLTNGSSELRAVICRGPLSARQFIYKAKTVEGAIGGSIATSASTRTSAYLPAGVTCLAKLLFSLSGNASNPIRIYLSSLSEDNESAGAGRSQIATSQAVSSDASALIDVYAESAQFRVRASASGGNSSVAVHSYIMNLAG